MRRRLAKVFLCCLILSGMFFFDRMPLFSAEPSASPTLEKGFQNPPDSVRPSVYWYWINDNISKEGVVRDLEAMAEVGIGGAYIGNIGEQDMSWGSVKIFSDEWWDATHTALKTASRLGITIGMFNSPGWSQSGGPWVKPEQSMRYLAVSEVNVSGPQKFEQKIAAPGEHFQDVRTIAFKSPKNDRLTLQSLKPQINSEPAVANIGDIADGKQETIVTVPKNTPSLTIDFVADSDFAARALLINVTQPTRAKVEVLVKENDAFRSVKTAVFDRSNPSINVGFIPYAPVVISLPATAAKQFRLVFSEIHGGTFSEINLTASPRVEAFAEKELAKMWPTPLPLWGAYMWPEQPVVDDEQLVITPKQVLDISKNMKTDGTLTWDVPDGDWGIQRTGMLTTGVTNSPATPEAKGLEIDKMSAKHAAFHFDAYFGKILERIPAADRKTLKVVVQDSYETGGQNWTDSLIAEFQKNYGYDPVPFIPVLNGRVVGSQDMSDRFLWDLRRLIADKVAYEYVGGLRKAANKHGLTTWLECYGHWGFPGEFLQYGGQSDGVGGEFWNEGDLGSIENRAASSCAHIYGKTKVTAESFTAAGRVYERYPALLKKRCDWSYTEGINDTLLHLYIHQPYEDRTPGVNAWFATEFNRKNTWFSQVKPFVEYMRRCMFMLRQGLNVADVAYFIGEDAPKMTGVCDPPLPKGYSFDYINGEVIRDRLTVKQNRLMLPHGTTYRLLVLPKQQTMRPELLRKIKTLVEQGAVVLGPAPTKSPSMQNFPKCDAEVQKLAAELWGNVDGINVKSRKVGRGQILSGMSVQEALDLIQLAADCKIDHPETLYVHRKLGQTDIYFVTNQTDKPIQISPEFRVDGMVPELWDANTGEMRRLRAFEQRGNLTQVPMQLDSFGSAFVVFRQKGKPAKSGLQANFPTPEVMTTINGPWQVDFDKAMRGPETPQTFEKLEDWGVSANDAIKYYSGTATYKTTFEVADSVISELPKKKMLLNLGTVNVIASVKINGQDAGTVWTAPWQVDATGFLKKGTNTLEVAVVNTWANRLIGDVRLPEAERKTWLTVNPFKPDNPLMPSGLIGPVTLQQTVIAD